MQFEILPGADSGALSDKVLQLQKEMNVAMGWLLTTMATLDTQCRRLVSNTKTAIKESKTLCTTAIWDTEATCAPTIREAETACTDHTHTLQQSLEESMQDLECKAIKKEGWDCQSFLEVCGAALQACPMEVWGVHMYPLQLLMGNMPLATLLATMAQLTIPIGRPTPTTPLQP